MCVIGNLRTRSNDEPPRLRTKMTGDPDVAIIGAGPYGLSIAAHLNVRGIEFRIFGRPMNSWRLLMPAGMFLKSEAFASRLYDPEGSRTLRRFCYENNLPYEHTGLDVPVEAFAAYGLDFQRRLVPGVEEKTVVGLHKTDNGFILQLCDDETMTARHVVVAVGLTYFPHIPAGLAHLPPEAVSHSSDHRETSRFGGSDVSVIGAGASALDLAASLHDCGAKVRLVARRSALSFNLRAPTPWWKRFYPTSGLGGGWRNQFYEHAPMLFRRLPSGPRRWIVQSELPPSGGVGVKDKVERVPLLLGHSLRYARFNSGRVHLRLLCPDGEERTLHTDHVIAGTGYRATCDGSLS